MATRSSVLSHSPWMSASGTMLRRIERLGWGREAEMKLEAGQRQLWGRSRRLRHQFLHLLGELVHPRDRHDLTRLQRLQVRLDL